jgi:hypothetical protein
MEEDVINRMDEETFEGCFSIFVSIEFKDFDTMESSNGSNLGASRALWEDWCWAWIGWTNVGHSGGNNGVGGVGEDEAEVAMVSST